MLPPSCRWRHGRRNEAPCPGRLLPARSRRMPNPNSASSLRPLHRLWRLLPAHQRRALLARGTALLAPRPDRRPPPPAGRHGGGRRTGARLRPRRGGAADGAAIAGLGVPTWQADIGVPLPGEQPAAAAARGRAGRRAAAAARQRAAAALGAAAPAARPGARPPGDRLLGLGTAGGAGVLAGRPGFRARDLGACRASPPRRSAPGCRPAAGIPVRTVPLPVAVAPPEPAPLDRAAFGLPDAAVVVLVSFSLASSNVRKNPLGAIAAFRAAFGDRADRLLLLKIGNPGHFPAEFAALRDAVAGSSEHPAGDPHPAARRQPRPDRLRRHRAVAAPQRRVRPGARRGHAARPAGGRHRLVGQHGFHGRRLRRPGRLPAGAGARPARRVRGARRGLGRAGSGRGRGGAAPPGRRSRPRGRRWARAGRRRRGRGWAPARWRRRCAISAWRAACA